MFVWRRGKSIFHVSHICRAHVLPGCSVGLFPVIINFWLTDCGFVFCTWMKNTQHFCADNTHNKFLVSYGRNVTLLSGCYRRNNIQHRNNIQLRAEFKSPGTRWNFCLPGPLKPNLKIASIELGAQVTTSVAQSGRRNNNVPIVISNWFTQDRPSPHTGHQ